MLMVVSVLLSTVWFAERKMCNSRVRLFVSRSFPPFISIYVPLFPTLLIISQMDWEDLPLYVTITRRSFVFFSFHCASIEFNCYFISVQLTQWRFCYQCNACIILLASQRSLRIVGGDLSSRKKFSLVPAAWL